MKRPKALILSRDHPNAAPCSNRHRRSRRLVLSSYVMTPGCVRLPGVMLNFWQADADGEYDNSGFRLRGHQFTDDRDRYRLEMIFQAFTQAALVISMSRSGRAELRY
jgi:protocatechuate 3,4-dioxygenase beta subunit